MSAMVDDTNAAALRLRDVFATMRLDRFVPATELRKVAPFYGYVDVKIGGVPPLSMLSNNDDFVAERYFWYGTNAYEPMSLRVWAALARQSATVLDVGAYTGVYALAAAAVHRKAKVYAFEALDRVYFRMLLNRDVNRLGNLQVFHVAVCESAGELELNVYSGESILVSGSSLFDADPMERQIVQKKRVRAESLDELVLAGSIPSRPSLLKIDTEGAEHLVLRGAAGIVEQSKPDIICELLRGAHTADIEDQLRTLGYRFLRIDDREMRLVPVECLAPAEGLRDLNTLFTTKTDAELDQAILALLG